MAQDPRTLFVDGLRVTAAHMQHLQDALREAVLDVRRVIGLGHIGWGLRITVAGNRATISPGVAFTATVAACPATRGAQPARYALPAKPMNCLRRNCIETSEILWWRSFPPLGRRRYAKKQQSPAGARARE